MKLPEGLIDEMRAYGVVEAEWHPSGAIKRFVIAREKPGREAKTEPSPPMHPLAEALEERVATEADRLKAELERKAEDDMERYMATEGMPE